LGNTASICSAAVISFTQALDEAVEVVLVENLIQSRVKRVGGTARQVLGCHPHRGLIRMPLSFAHRHRQHVVRGMDRVDPFRASDEGDCPREVRIP
jgi:hypothetical protein